MDVSDFFFFCSGWGKGESEAAGKGVDSLLKIPGGGWFSGKGPKGRQDVFAANWGFRGFWGGGRGAKFFFFVGAEMSTKLKGWIV